MNLLFPFSPIVYDLIAFIALSIFTIRGVWRGAIKEILTILTIVASIVLAKPFGYLPFIADFVEPVPSFLRDLVSVSIGGVVAYFTFVVVFFILVRVLKLNRAWEGAVLTWIRIGGGISGAIFGGFMTLSVGWFILFAGAFPIPPMPGGQERSQIFSALLFPSEFASAHKESFQKSLTGRLSHMTNPIPASITTGMSIVTEISQDPEKLQVLIESEPVQKMIHYPSIQKLKDNAEIQALATQGDMAGLLNHPDVQAALNDPEVQKALKEMDPKELKKMMEEYSAQGKD